MRRIRLEMVLTCLAVVSHGWCGAGVARGQVTNLFNTGVAAGAGFVGGGVLADNAVDPHYTVAWDGGGIGPTAIVATSAGGNPIPPWVADNAISAWTTPAANTQGPNDAPPTLLFFTYTTSFTTSLPGQLTISGLISARDCLSAAAVSFVTSSLLFACISSEAVSSFC